MGEISEKQTHNTRNNSTSTQQTETDGNSATNGSGNAMHSGAGVSPTLPRHLSRPYDSAHGISAIHAQSILNLQRVYGNQAVGRMLQVTSLIQREPAVSMHLPDGHESTRPKSQHHTPKGHKHGAKSSKPVGTPLEIPGNTFEEAAKNTVATITGIKSPTRIIVIDSHYARVFDDTGNPVSEESFKFPQPITITTGVFIQPPGQKEFHAFMVTPDNQLALSPHPVAWKGDKINISNAFVNQAGFDRLVSSGPRIIVMPTSSNLAGSTEPEVKDDTPDFLKPSKTEHTANYPAYPARLTPTTPLVTSVDSTGTFIMKLDKDQGFGMVDRVTNIMQPVSFHWEVVKVKPSKDNEIGQLAGQMQAGKRSLDIDDSSAQTIQKYQGTLEAYKRRLRHIADDTDEILGTGDSADSQQSALEQKIMALNAGAIFMMEGARALFAIAGETVIQFLKTLLLGQDPYVEDTMDIPWKEDGIFLVRGIATPRSHPGDAVRRASSYVGAVVAVHDIKQIAQNSIPTEQDERAALKERLAKLEQRRDALSKKQQSPDGLGMDEEDELEYLDRDIAKYQSKLGTVGNPRGRLQGEVAEIDKRLSFLNQIGEVGDLSQQEQAELKELTRRRESLQGILTRADTRLDTQPGKSVMMQATFVDDTSGGQQSLFFAISERKTVNYGNITIQIADVSDSKGATFSDTSTDRAEAWNGALADLRKHLGRGRGWLSYRVPSEYAMLKLDLPNPMKLQMSATDQTMELVQDVANVGTLIAIMAAPFTAGASLALLLPLGIAGAAASLYRLAEREVYGTLEFDAEAIGDLINIASLGIGRLGAAGEAATRLQLVFSEGKVAARVLEGGGYMVMAYSTWKEMAAASEDDNPDPREARVRAALALLNAAQTVGMAAAQMHLSEYTTAGTKSNEGHDLEIRTGGKGGGENDADMRSQQGGEHTRTSGDSENLSGTTGETTKTTASGDETTQQPGEQGKQATATSSPDGDTQTQLKPPDIPLSGPAAVAKASAEMLGTPKKIVSIESTPMSSAGDPGSLSSNNGLGVFKGKIEGVSEEVAIKVFRDNKAHTTVMHNELEGALAASATGFGPKVYGTVEIGPGKIGFAMEIIKGGFVDALPTSNASPAQVQAAHAEAQLNASHVNDKTLNDIVEFGRRLEEQGYYIKGDFQGFVDADGNWRPIDMTSVKKLPPQDSPAYADAKAQHARNIAGEWKKLKAAGEQAAPLREFMNALASLPGAAKPEMAAKKLIDNTGDWKGKLSALAEVLPAAKKAQAETALATTRKLVIEQVFAEQIKTKYPDAEMAMTGTNGFGSTVAVTITASGSTGSNQGQPAQPGLSAQIAGEFKAALHAEVGGEPARVLDTTISAMKAGDNSGMGGPPNAAQTAAGQGDPQQAPIYAGQQKSGGTQDTLSSAKVVESPQMQQDSGQPGQQVPLVFGAEDLVYGPSAQGELRKLADQAGGKLLTDLPKPPDLDWTSFSLQTLDKAAAKGTKIHFDLTNMHDLKGILAGTGKFAGTVTAQELRHILDNWGRFKDVVKFYRNGVEVEPPK